MRSREGLRPLTARCRRHKFKCICVCCMCVIGIVKKKIQEKKSKKKIQEKKSKKKIQETKNKKKIKIQNFLLCGNRKSHDLKSHVQP